MTNWMGMGRVFSWIAEGGIVRSQPRLCIQEKNVVRVNLWCATCKTIASVMLGMHRRVHLRAFSRSTICAWQVFAVMPDKFVMLFLQKNYTYNVFFCWILCNTNLPVYGLVHSTKCIANLFANLNPHWLKRLTLVMLLNMLWCGGTRWKFVMQYSTTASVENLVSIALPVRIGMRRRRTAETERVRGIQLHPLHLQGEEPLHQNLDYRSVDGTESCATCSRMWAVQQFSKKLLWLFQETTGIRIYYLTSTRSRTHLLLMGRCEFVFLLCFFLKANDDCEWQVFLKHLLFIDSHLRYWMRKERNSDFWNQNGPVQILSLSR